MKIHPMILEMLETDDWILVKKETITQLTKQLNEMGLQLVMEDIDGERGSND